ncbi:protein of unknown function [Ruminococcaceae bacterium BL-4]|nr:protein of unknown function [Ruminococcaceae bacterium BL-4]
MIGGIRSEILLFNEIIQKVLNSFLCEVVLNAFVVFAYLTKQI